MRTRDETRALAETGLDALALKPAEVDLRRVAERGPPMDIVVDYEGRERFPDGATIADLAADRSVRVTVPVRAEGFDPLGDDGRLDTLSGVVDLALVAGNAAYLTAAERERAVAPRLRAAAERFPDAWVGTEGIERLALAVGGTQFDLLTGSTEQELAALRAAGHEGELAVYAPVVVAADEDTVLDAVGPYAARRGPVRAALPDCAATDSTATGRTREVLSEAVREYALVGDRETVRERVAALREAGADRVVGYPARGV
jgi:hypothetical protein